MMKDTCTIWVCVDCMLHHANGECGSCHTDEGHDREPLELIEYENGKSVTMGMLDSEHAEDCQRRIFADNLFAATSLPDRDYECDCETRSFSWSSCDGCGSTLGGERHAMTLWFD